VSEVERRRDGEREKKKKKTISKILTHSTHVHVARIHIHVGMNESRFLCGG
jgi:hypothetical protein